MTTRLMSGDCRAVLPTLDADSFDCIVTSPPYWGLRDYGVAGQIGLEPTLDAYVDTMAELGDDLWRVLKPEGTFWLNLGDSYASTPPGNKTMGVSAKSGLNGVNGASGAYRATLAAGHATKRDTIKSSGLKPKDLCGVPWRVAFALQSRGWWLRSAIIWAKPNPMPESVTDRPTSAYEMVFLLTKAERYYYDADAIAEEFTAPKKSPGGFAPEKATGPMARNGHSQWDKRRTIDASYPNETRNARNVWFGEPNGSTEENAEALQTMRTDSSARRPGVQKLQQQKGSEGSNAALTASNLWTIATQPFKGSHFATMPPGLVERCVKAGCPRGGHVLDPFGGAGTTGLVVDRLGRNATLIELSPRYCNMAAARITDDAPLFAEVVQ